jgi:hypothetical protein
MKAASKGTPAITLPVEIERCKRELTRRALEGSTGAISSFAGWRPLIDSPPPFLSYRAGLARWY